MFDYLLLVMFDYCSLLFSTAVPHHTDESLTPDSLYYYVINIKESGANSLVVLDLASHTVQESLQEARVPDGSAYYTLEGHLSQLDVVFLHRFLQVWLWAIWTTNGQTCWSTALDVLCLCCL